MRVAGAVRTDSADREITRRLCSLTVRQREVLDLLADGKTGMGLVLARAAIEGEHGALSVKNRGQGGCEVELTVPLRAR